VENYIFIFCYQIFVVVTSWLLIQYSYAADQSQLTFGMMPAHKSRSNCKAVQLTHKGESYVIIVIVACM